MNSTPKSSDSYSGQSEKPVFRDEMVEYSDGLPRHSATEIRLPHYMDYFHEVREINKKYQSGEQLPQRWHMFSDRGHPDHTD